MSVRGERERKSERDTKKERVRVGDYGDRHRERESESRRETQRDSGREKDR